MIARLFVHPDSFELRGIWRAALFWFLLVFLFALPRLMPLAARQGESGAPVLIPLIATYAVEVAAALLLTLVFARLFDNRPLVSAGLRIDGKAVVQLVVGILWGASAVALVTVLLLICGAVVVTKTAADPGELARGLVLGLCLFTLVGLFEELQMRGYPLQALLREHRPATAVTIVSLVFAALHIPNSHFVAIALPNTFLAGVWFALAYMKTRRLWLPIGLHTGWNFAMGSLFGFAVSGNEQLTSSVFSAASQQPGWLSGGTYGPEGGVAAMVVLVACAMLMEVIRRKAPDEEHAG